LLSGTGFTINGNVLWADNAALLAEGVHTLRIRVTDRAGASFEGSVDVTVIDPAPPTLTVAASNPTLKAGETTELVFRFSKPVAHFSGSDISVAPGNVGTLHTLDNITYPATFTPPALVDAATATVTVATGAAYDVIGNPS